MSNSVRDNVKDIIRMELELYPSTNMCIDERICNLADDIFESLGIRDIDQDCIAEEVKVVVHRDWASKE